MRTLDRLILIVALMLAVTGSIALCAQAYDLGRAETVRLTRTG